MEDVYIWADIYGPSPSNPNENVFSLCVLAEDYEKAIKEIDKLKSENDALRNRKDGLDDLISACDALRHRIEVVLINTVQGE